jgi:hypothetical protein
MRTALTVMSVVLLAALAGLTMTDDAAALAPDDPPYITLEQPGVSGKTIQGQGTFSTGKLTFKSITLFAVLKDGGRIFSKSINTKPTGKNWPESGTLDLTVQYKGTYKVWAVLHLRDGPTTNVYYGSGLREVTVTEGDNPPANLINWGVNQPTAANGTISGSGTYTVPENSEGRQVVLWVIPTDGGLAVADAATTNENVTPATWTEAEITGLTAGASYNVYAVYALTWNGVPVQYTTTIVSRTP